MVDIGYRRYFMLMISLIIALFLVGNISAGSCVVTERAQCAGTIVFAIDNEANSHAELGDQGNYDYVLCCDFGEGNTTCDEENKIIGLEEETNSHVEVSSMDNYQNDVCYEDLSCTSRVDNCNLGEVGLISLSADTNAHVGNFGDYDTKICCSSQLLDFDGDGILNIHDPDFDGDGVMDYPYDLVDPNGDIDGDGILNIDDEDMDGDGILNGHDPDFDGDGVMDQFLHVYWNGDIDGDSIINIHDEDIDGDGILNGYDSDVDGDGVIDSVCGDGVIEVGEECDDGDNNNNDGCSRTCKDESERDRQRSSGSRSSSSDRCDSFWQCSDWGECEDGIQRRTCDDLNNCETNSKTESRACEESSMVGLIVGNQPGQTGEVLESVMPWMFLIAIVIILLIIVFVILRR